MMMATAVFTVRRPTWILRRFIDGLPFFRRRTLPGDAVIVPYALGRIWDTAIGLTIGMAVNMLIFPYDNGRQIRETPSP